MKVIMLPTCALTLVAFVLSLSGCSQQGPAGAAPIDISGPPPSGHNHASTHHGPHDGHVIDLGRSHEYHAELVENAEAGTLTVYVLDKDLKEKPIDQSSIVLNLMVEGQVKTFELAATTAAEGAASRFDATDTTIISALHEHNVTGKLRVTINGTPYNGEFELHHSHNEASGHGHSH